MNTLTLDTISDLATHIGQKIAACINLAELDALKTEALGKNSPLTDCLRQLGSLPEDQRPAFGQKVNEAKQKLLTQLEEKRTQLEAVQISEKLKNERVDITLPSGETPIGTLHPITQTLNQITEVFQALGYSIAQGPEIESDFYNFEALNIPADHPARDMHDTFYLTNGKLLRTHTSPVQIRVLQNQKPPVQIIVPGKVYRCDSDTSHLPVFHQVEGLMVGENIAFTHLKGTLEHFLKTLFGQDKKVRFRPSYFPFTEPSAEVDVACVICNQTGCNVCKHTGWLEILGCGMIHPNVLKAVNIDPAVYSGFAFGLGVERIAMLKLGVQSIRSFLENDVRFLAQFEGAI